MDAIQNMVRGLGAGQRMTSRNALVIGGGFVGAAAAWRLQQAGFATILIDAGDPARAASFGNAGHLASEQVTPLASIATLLSLHKRLYSAGGPAAFPPRDIGAWLPFGLRFIAATRRFDAGARALKALVAAALPAWHRLADQIGATDLIREQGHFVVWEKQATAQAGIRAACAIDYGYANAREATGDELSTLGRYLAIKPAGAVRFTGTGQVADLQALRGKLDDAFRQAGGAKRIGQVARLEIENGAARAILTDGTALNAERILVAGGAWSGDLLRGIDGPVPLIAERGYHIDTTVTEAEWPRDIPPIAFGDRSAIITRFANTLRMTSFTEFSRIGAPSDKRKWAKLDAHADALGLPKGSLRTRWIGNRPTLPDYLPAIGCSRKAGNLLYAFGHQHLGVTLAAITGELVAACAGDTQPSIPLAPYDLHRFG
jgi:D-amino-acid dehydrogenase